jgi:sedoheptulokinase
MELILAIDIGTSSIAAAVMDTTNRPPLGAASLPNDSTAHGLSEKHHEQAPERIWELCCDAGSSALARAGKHASGRVQGIALTGQMHGVMLIDRHTLAPATRLITWRDRRTSDILDRQGLMRTGCALHPGYGARTLAWLLEHRPDMCRGTVAVSAADFVAARLTGIAATEETHAASWGLLDLSVRSLDSTRCRSLHIPAALIPPLRPSATLLGPLRCQAAARFGLVPGIPVFSPVGDNQASVAGAAGLAPDTAVVNIGTGGQISVPVPAAAQCPPLEIRPMPQQGFIQVGATLCAGWAYAYLRAFYGAVLRTIGNVSVPDETIYERMNCLLKSDAPPAGTMPVWDTRFDGSRSEPHTRGSIAGLDTANLTPQHLTTACAQGIVDELAALATRADLNAIRHIVVTGTAAQKIPGLVERVGAAVNRPAAGHDSEWDALRGAALFVRQTAGQTSTEHSSQ